LSLLILLSFVLSGTVCFIGLAARLRTFSDTSRVHSVIASKWKATMIVAGGSVRLVARF